MRALCLVALALLLAATALAKGVPPGIVEDDHGDVTRFDGEVVQPAEFPRLDVVSVRTWRDADDVLVTVRFADELPLDVDLAVKHRISATELGWAGMTFVRSEVFAPQGRVGAFFDNASLPEGSTGALPLNATIGAQAVEFVFPASFIDQFPCFAFESLEVSSLGEEDGEAWLYVDTLETEATCPAIPEPEQSAPEVSTPPKASEPSEKSERKETPIPWPAVMAAVGAAALIRARR